MEFNKLSTKDIFNKILINHNSLIIDHLSTKLKIIPILINYDELYDSYILTTQVRYIISEPNNIVISDYYSNIKYLYDESEYNSCVYTFTADLFNTNSHRYFNNSSSTCCKFVIKHINSNRYSIHLYDDFMYQLNKKKKSILSNAYDYIVSYFTTNNNNFYTFAYANLFYGENGNTCSSNHNVGTLVHQTITPVGV